MRELYHTGDKLLVDKSHRSSFLQGGCLLAQRESMGDGCIFGYFIFQYRRCCS